MQPIREGVDRYFPGLKQLLEIGAEAVYVKLYDLIEANEVSELANQFPALVDYLQSEFEEADVSDPISRPEMRFYGDLVYWVTARRQA